MGVKVCSHPKCNHQIYTENFPPLKVFKHEGKEYCSECIIKPDLINIRHKL